MSNQYSRKTIDILRTRFVATFSKGRQQLIDLDNDFCEVSYIVLLSSAGQIEGDFKHSKWGDDYQKNLGEIRSRLPQVIKNKYLPNEPLLVPIKGGYENQYFLNTYIQPSITPNSEVLDCSLFLEFMERQFRVREERNMVLALMAANIRQPQKKIRLALLLRGQQGTGKGVLMDHVWGALCGGNYMKCKCSDVVARFNSFLASKTLICIDELYGSSKKNADKLKTPITEEKINVEIKGEERLPADNYSFIVATTNEHCPVYLEEGDRRWFVPEFSTHLVNQKETQEFIENRFMPWLNDSGLQSIRNYLEQYKLDSYNLNIAMDTPSKKELLQVDKREESLEELLCFIQDNRYYGIRLSALKGMYPTISESDICSVLRNQGYEKTTNARSICGYKRCRWWLNVAFKNMERCLYSPVHELETLHGYNFNNTSSLGVHSVQDSCVAMDSGIKSDTEYDIQSVLCVEGV